MTSLAAANRGMAKLVVIGKSGQGQDIVALKVTKDARNVADGARPAMLFSAVNHAREWIAAEVGRRMPTWWLEHADDPEIAELLSRNELWFLPIQNPDGYDYTFTCGIGFRSADERDVRRHAGHRPGRPAARDLRLQDGRRHHPSRRTPRSPTRPCASRRSACGARPCATTTATARSATARTASTPTATTRRPGASTRRARATRAISATYRGPFPLSETEDLAYDRLLRKITPEAVINYHSAAQLLLYPFGYITDVYADDDPWFKAITGTDGDAAVDPYISQRSSDLYITNGETTDHAYNKYGSMSWTPELDECETAAGGTFCSGGSGFTFPDDEGKVEAVFEKNLDFARNVAATTLDRDRPDRPRNATDDETQYQVKALAGHRAEPVQRLLRRRPDRRGDDAQGPRARRLRGPGTGTAPAAPARTLDAPRRRRGAAVSASATCAASTTSGSARRSRPTSSSQVIGTRLPARPLVAGDDGQRPRDRGLPAAALLLPRRLHAAGGQRGKRVLVVAAEDYKGLSPEQDAVRRPLRATSTSTSRRSTANGYTVETYDVDNPPAGPNGRPARSSSRTSAS